MSRIVAQGLEFGGWVLLARGLGTAGVGTLAVASIIARMLGLVADWGAAVRGPRDVVRAGRDSDLVVALVRRRQRVSVVLAGAMLVALVVSGDLAVAPIVVTVLARGSGRDWIALGEARRWDAVAPLLLQGALVLAAVSFTSSIAAGAWALAFGHGLGLLLSIKLNPVRPSRSLPRVAVDSWYLISSLADQVLVSADTVLLVIIQSSTEAGIYVSVYRLPLAWLTLVGLCTAAAVPIAAGVVGRDGMPVATAHRNADRVAVLGLLATVPVAAVGVALMVPLFGADFESGRMALIILFAAAGVTTASAPYRVLYTAFADDRRVALVMVAAAATNLVANLAVIGKWGIEGAATTTLLAQIGVFAYLLGWSASARRDQEQVPSEPVGV